MSIFNRNGPFADNVRILERAIGKRCEEAPVGRVLLTAPDNEEWVVRPVRGSNNSIAFFFWLTKLKGGNEFVLDTELQEIAKDFYADLWDEPGHSTIARFKHPGLKIEVFPNTGPQS